MEDEAASAWLLDRARRTDPNPNTRRFGLWILATIRRSFILQYHIAYCLSGYFSLFAGLYTVFQPSTASVIASSSLRKLYCLLRDAAVCLLSPDAVAPPTRLMPFCPCDRCDSPSLLNRTQSRVPRALFGHGEVFALLASGCAEPGPA